MIYAEKGKKSFNTKIQWTGKKYLSTFVNRYEEIVGGDKLQLKELLLLLILILLWSFNKNIVIMRTVFNEQKLVLGLLNVTVTMKKFRNNVILLELLKYL